MAVRTKGRRKLVCNDKLYLWHVKAGYDDGYYWLHVISEDRKLYMICPLYTEEKILVRHADGTWTEKTPEHILTPWVYVKIENSYCHSPAPYPLPKTVTPGFVASLIHWAENFKQ